MVSDNIIVALLAVTIIILLLIAAIFIVIIMARRQSLTLELKEAVYQNKLNEISLASLRSQMNPHFIFNCLNSIKLYTEQNNSEAASEYLSKFAGLIRSILDNARSEKVALSEDIKLLDLYLQMEVMRFKEKLHYTIDIENNVDADFIEIPPMLIQPYVENAIWHGLMQRKEGGRISIHFKQINDQDMLEIRVWDNGIGRKKASELKNHKVKAQHKSHGTQISSERLALINEKYNVGASVAIIDLKDEEGEAAGTLVTIKLPIR